MSEAATLRSAVALIGEVRADRMLMGDRDSARLLARLAELVDDEAALLEGVERWNLPLPDRSGPPGAALGWFLRYDATTRRLRALHGLPVPEAHDAAA